MRIITIFFKSLTFIITSLSTLLHLRTLFTLSSRLEGGEVIITIYYIIIFLTFLLLHLVMVLITLIMRTAIMIIIVIVFMYLCCIFIIIITNFSVTNPSPIPLVAVSSPRFVVRDNMPHPSLPQFTCRGVAAG